MLTCIVVDDEQHAVKVMEMHIAATAALTLLGSFRDPVEAMNWLSANEADIVFLDVDMPKMTGIEFAKAIKGRSKIILCTAYPEYGVVSYEHDVVDYLLKPVVYARFFQAVEKVTKLVNDGQLSTEMVQTEFMMIKNGGKLMRINFEDIVYLAADRNYTKFQLTGRSFMHFVLLKDVVEKLPPKQFMRVHHSYVVAINKIAQMDKNTILLKNCDTPVPVSEKYRPGVLKILNAAG